MNHAHYFSNRDFSQLFDNLTKDRSFGRKDNMMAGFTQISSSKNSLIFQTSVLTPFSESSSLKRKNPRYFKKPKRKN